MGVLDLFKRKKQDKKVEAVIIEPKQPVEQKPVFKPVPITALELKEAIWPEFAATLKAKGILPNSYDRNPVEVKTCWAENNSPCVELLFKSKTSKSERKIVLTEDSAQEIVNNGALKANDLIMSEWRNFQRGIRFRRQYKKRDEIDLHKQMGEALKRRNQEKVSLAEKYLKIADLFEAEKEFVEKHKNDKYEFFGYFGTYEGETPFFVVYDEKSDGFQHGTMVHAFSPKTLEFCVSRLVADEKIFEAENLDIFKEKCQDVAKSSIYQTEDWNHTIDMLCDMLKENAKQTENSVQNNQPTAEQERI